MKAIRVRAAARLTEAQWRDQRRRSASPAECFKECRRNLRMLMKTAKKLNMKNEAWVLLGLEAAMDCVNDAENHIFKKYCA